MLTIDNMMFAGTALATTPVTKPVPVANDPQFSQAPDNTYPSYNTFESITTDNISTVAQNENISKPKRDFKQALRKVETEPPQQNQKNAKSDKEYSVAELPSKAKPTESPSAPEIPITLLGTLVKENATKMEPKTGSQLAQLIANLKDGKSNPVTGHVTKSTEIKLYVTTDKGQSGLKSVLPDSSSDQHKLQTSLSSISKGISTTDTQLGKSKNNDKISASNGNVVTTKAPTNAENTKELISEALFDTKGKKALTNEKAFILGTSAAASSTKSPALNGEKASSNTLIGNGSKTTKENKALTDKAIIHTDEKTPVLNANFSQVRNKITGQDSKHIGIAPENSTQNANITTDSKKTNPEIISESSNSNNKETQNTGNKLSDNSTIRDLNTTNIQISINQTKNHNSSTHNKNQNSDFEQIPNHNNPTTSVTELSSNSAEGTRTVELPAQTSSNNISAGIGKQILESIHSSSSQVGRNQQITVQLNPPELGKVFIKFQEQDNHITGLLEVSETQTRIEVDQAIPQIVKDLQDSGIPIKRLDVVLSQEEQPEQEALREQTLQNGWAQQQGSSDSYTDRDNTDEINEWLINNKSYGNISELQESYTTNNSINMLI